MPVITRVFYWASFDGGQSLPFEIKSDNGLHWAVADGARIALPNRRLKWEGRAHVPKESHFDCLGPRCRATPRDLPWSGFDGANPECVRELAHGGDVHWDVDNNAWPQLGARGPIAMSSPKNDLVKTRQCVACNGYLRLPDEPDRDCRYCGGSGVDRSPPLPRTKPEVQS